MRRFVNNIGEDKPSNITIDILQSMRMADYAQKNVTDKTIRNCFIKAEFLEYVASRETKEVDSTKQITKVGELNPE